MVLAWGRELVTLHNDADRPPLGTKGAAFGRSVLDVSAEARGTLAPLLKRAFAGEACRFADAPFTLLRRGEPEADWTIVAASDARLRVTGTTREPTLGFRSVVPVPICARDKPRPWRRSALLAGFGGGARALLAGLLSRDTTLAEHWGWQMC